jgi:peptide/nickel transport system substrate-binding protein
MTTTRRRSVASAAAGLLLLGGLAACGGGSDAAGSGDDGGTPVSGGTLNVSFFPDNPTFKCIDPFQVYWIEHRSVIRNFADSLTDQDPETGEIDPWLAKSWEVSPDGLTYTFHLKDGVTFSNGDKLDAQAVADNVQGWLDTVKATNGVAYGASYILGLKGAKVIDPLTVELDFSEPNSSFLQATSTTNLAIIDPKDYQESPEDRCLGKNLIASGPFVLDHYTPDTEIVLKKRDTPYTSASSLVKNQGDAYLDEVKFTYVAEDSVRTGNLTSGAIDIDWPRNPITPEDQQVIKASGASIESRSLPGPANNFYANTAPGKILSDKTVREALYKAIDAKTYAQTIFGDDYPVVSSVFDTTTPYYKDESAKLGFDPDGAKKLLDQDGWTVGSDGIRTKDGKKLTVVYPVIGQFTAGAELLQDQLKQVGIDLELHTLTTAEQATYLNDGDYDLTTNYFTRADPGALQFILDPDLANSKALATNAASADQIAQIKSLFTKAYQTTDTKVAAQAYGDLQDYLLDQAITYPLYERLQVVGVSSKVHGFAWTSESFLRLNDTWKSS